MTFFMVYLAKGLFVSNYLTLFYLMIL